MPSGGTLQCFCLVNPRDGGAWWAAIYGVPQSHSFYHCCLWAPECFRYMNRRPSSDCRSYRPPRLGGSRQAAQGHLQLHTHITGPDTTTNDVLVSLTLPSCSTVHRFYMNCTHMFVQGGLLSESASGEARAAPWGQLGIRKPQKETNTEQEAVGQIGRAHV